MNLDHIFNEADQIIEKRASAKKEETVKTAKADDSSVKFASAILEGKFDTKQAESFTDLEKMAHAVAIVDTLINLNEIVKLEKFASAAEAKGATPEQVTQFLEKKASETPIISVAELVGFTKEGGARQSAASIAKKTLLTGGTLGGVVAAHQIGKSKGRDEALEDVRKAFMSYNPGE